MTFNEFLLKQDNIYENFEKVKNVLISDGLKPKISLDTKLSGYLIMCRHSVELSSDASYFSELISKEIPALNYKPEHIHTTISDFLMSESTTFDQNILDKLAQVVISVKSKITPFSIVYSKWLINQNSIIAAGHPDEMFFIVADLIIRGAQDLGINLRYPYMSHITVSRFFEEVYNTEKIQKLIKLVDQSKPLGVSQIERIEIGFVSHYGGKIEFKAGITENLT